VLDQDSEHGDRAQGDLELGAEVWTAADDDVDERFRLRHVDDALLLQHEKGVQLRRGALPRDSARRNDRRELGRAVAVGAPQRAPHYLVHLGGVRAASTFHQLHLVQFLQLK